MKWDKDGNGSVYIEWTQAEGGYKRAWIKHLEKGDEKDWACTQRYLMIVRCNAPGRIGGNPTDFPIFYTEQESSDRQILLNFVNSVNSITGCLPSGE